jgi:hypothetical protein
MTNAEIGAIAGLTEPARVLIEDGQSPSQYLDALERKSLYQDAIRFLAIKLEARRAIEWAHETVKELQAPEKNREQSASFAATGDWLKTPTDETRRQARKAADESGMSAPEDLVAMAVFLSGGSVAPPGAPETPAPQYTSQKMAAGGILLAVVAHAPERAEERYRKALQLGRAVDS